MFLRLYSINWPNFTVWLPLLLEILGNMCIVIVCFLGCDVIHFKINLISNQDVFPHDLENGKSFKDEIKHICLQQMKQGHNSKTCDQRQVCRNCKGNIPTAIQGYIPKDKTKVDSSSRQNNGKIGANNFVDLTVASTQENSDQEIISTSIFSVRFGVPKGGKF